MEVARRHIYLKSVSSTSSHHYNYTANHVIASERQESQSQSSYQKSQYEQQQRYRSIENGSLEGRRPSGSAHSLSNSRRPSDRNASINSLNRQRDMANTSQTSLNRQRHSSNTSLASINKQRRNASNNASAASLNRQKNEEQSQMVNGSRSNSLRNRSRTNSSHSSLSDNSAANRNQKSRSSTNSRASERTASGRQSKNSQRKDRPNLTSTPEPSNEAVVEEERFNRDGSKSIMRRKVTAATKYADEEEDTTKVEVHISPATETRVSPETSPTHSYDYRREEEERYAREEEERYAREEEERYAQEEEERYAREQEERYAREEREDYYNEEMNEAAMYEEENKEFYSSMMDAEQYTEEELRYMEEQMQLEENERLKREGIDYGMTRSDYDDGPYGSRRPRFKYPPRFGGKRPPGDGYPYDDYPDNGFPNDGFPDNGLPNGGYPNDGLPTGDFPDEGLPTDDFPEGGLPSDGFPNDGLPTDGFPDGALPTDDQGFDFDDMLAVDQRGLNYNHDFNEDDYNQKKMEFNARNQKLKQQADMKSKSVTLAQMEKESHQEVSMSDLSLYLKSDDTALKANTAAYIQHLIFREKHVKTEIRQYDIIQLLVELLSHENLDCHKNAAGALKNLSFGKNVEENKIAIFKAGGVKACASLLYKTSWLEVREHVTGILFNMSSVKTLKQTILLEAMEAVAILIIIPLSGWDKAHANAGRKPGPISWSLVLTHSTGILRNVSAEGIEARKYLRAIDGLIDALIWIVRAAISSDNRSDINNRIIENIICSLRNLSYRVDIEIDRSMYLDAMKVSTKEDGDSKNSTPSKDSISDTNSADVPLVNGSESKKKRNAGTGCLGMKKKPFGKSSKTFTNPLTSSSNKKPPVEQYKYLIPVRDSSPKPIGLELLWQPETVTYYIYLLTNSTNPITLEAGAAAIHNLCGCKWNWSALLRVHVRLQKGIPPMQDLLSVDQEYVVRSIAYTLRNLAIDKTNKWSIGKYAHKSLTHVLPPVDAKDDDDNPDEHTISAILSTLQVVVHKDMHNSRYIREDGAISKLMALTRTSTDSKNKQLRTYSKKVVSDANRVLLYMSEFKECRETMKSQSWSHSKSEEIEKSYKSSSLKKSSRKNADIYAYVDDEEKEELLGHKNRQRFIEEHNDAFSNSGNGDNIEMTPMANGHGVMTRERGDSAV